MPDIAKYYIVILSFASKPEQKCSCPNFARITRRLTAFRQQAEEIIGTSLQERPVIGTVALVHVGRASDNIERMKSRIFSK